jgi:putative holliday junction resolvase
LTRLLGVDVGERRIGLAVADTVAASIKPLATIRRSDDARDTDTLRHVCGEQRIDEIVIGLPLNMDGTEGPQAVATREWAAAVAAHLGKPVVWRDERLTSSAAEARLGRPRRGRAGGPPTSAASNARRARVDREAAATILQAELDARAIADGSGTTNA